MPPWEKVKPTQLRCSVCASPFLAKRASARYCSDQCRNKGRSPRTYDPAKSKAWRQRRLSSPGYKEAVNAQAAARIRAVKEWINAYKVEQGCIDCGYAANPIALDIDHMSGKTKNISALKSIDAVKAEIARHGCVVRCANCHRIKSWETRTWERQKDDSSTAS